MVRTLIPAISAASIQLSFLAMAFKMTSCSFIIHSISRAGMGWLTPPASTLPALDRTTHVLITPDNSHANDIVRAAAWRHALKRDIGPTGYAARKRLLYRIALVEKL